MVSAADLDLAFSADPLLAAPLRQAAAGLADAEAGEALWQEQLAAWLAALQGELPERLRAAAYGLSLSLCDDDAIAELNQDWRQRPGATDVLAFAACDGATDGPAALPLPPELAGGEPLELGDIMISVETAARQASEAGHDLGHELRFLASHGLLHLLGWDHPDEASLEEMLARQDRLLAVGPTGG
jgi:probable rRNA maturation factor